MDGLAMSERIVVSCAAGEGGWTCDVRVGQPGRESMYRVTVSADELARFGPGEADPARLVTRSFEFLLERESPGSILPRFALSVIERYFPEYPREIARRLG
jgi:hypothetical protein